MTIAAAYPAVRKAETNEADVHIGVEADSTSNESSEWVYLLAGWLADKYPTHTAIYHSWNATTAEWNAPESLSTGTGEFTMHLWNMSVSGKHWHYFQQHEAMKALPLDLLLVSLGHNDGSPLGRRQLYWGKQLNHLEDVLAFWHCPIILVSQNPQRDHDRQQHRAQWNAELAAMRGFGHIDVCSAFLAVAGWQTLLLSGDGIHPSTAGQQVWSDTVKAAFDNFDPNDQPGTQPPSSFFAYSPNLLTNGFFDDLTSGIPQGWTAFNVAGAQVSGEHGNQALELTSVLNSSGQPAQGYLHQTIPGTALGPYRGQTVYLAARTRKQTGASQNAGRVGINTGGSDGYLERTTTSDIGGDVWHWIGFPYDVPSTASNLQVRLYADTSASAGTKAVYDRVGLFHDVYPHDTI